jgi:hypothetical protein
MVAKKGGSSTLCLANAVQEPGTAELVLEKIGLQQFNKREAASNGQD